MASSLRRMTTRGGATPMPGDFDRGARRRGIRLRVCNVDFPWGVYKGGGEGRAGGGAGRFGKGRGARGALGILQNARARRRPVRIEATRAAACPTPLRRAAENVQHAARKFRATATGRRASLMALPQKPSAKPRARAALRRPVVKDLLRRSGEDGAVSPARGCGLRFAQRYRAASRQTVIERTELSTRRVRLMRSE